MLPIKPKRYNYLTGQFEDEYENPFSLLPTTSYPNFVPVTNEHDVEITRIKSDLGKYLAEREAEIRKRSEASEELRAAIVSNPGRRRYKVSNYERNWWGNMVETFRRVVEID